MKSGTGRLGVERLGFGAFIGLLLSPILAQGAWLPLVHFFGHFFGPAGSAVQVTLAALVLSGIASLLRWRGSGATAALLAGGLSALTLAGALSLGIAGLLTLLLVVSGNAALWRWWSPLLPPALDGLAARHRGLTALYLLVALSAVTWTARESVFLGDPSRGDLQVKPGIPFLESHSCLTAYVRAAELARQGVDNLYDDPWWFGSTGLPPRPEGGEDPYSPFALDNFSYPPTFLLVMAPLSPWQGDFLAQRALWFGLNGLLLAFSLWTLSRWVGGPGAHRILLLAPLFLGSMPILITLQIGNFHLAAVSLSLLAMIAVDRGRDGAGGALLALTILSKISPGVLGVVLLVRRQLRSAAFAAGSGLLLLLLALLCFGVEPIRSFLSFALPRLSSGAAFPPMATDAGILTNLSLFGFPFKLQYLGLDVGDPWSVGPWIGRAYTLVVLLLSVLAARRGGDRREQAIRWMALLVVAAMQSPFAPAYAALGLLWATTLLSTEVRRPIGAIGLVALWPAVLSSAPELSPAGVLLSMAQTVLILGLSMWLITRAPRGPLPHSETV